MSTHDDGRAPKNPAEALRRLKESVAEDEIDASRSPGEVKAELEAMGIDAGALAKRGAAFAKALLEKRRLAWHADSDANQARAKDRMEAARKARRVDFREASVPVLQAAIARRRIGLGGSVAVGAFRQRKAEEASREELLSIIDQLDDLRALAGLPPVDDDANDEGSGEGEGGGEPSGE